MPNLPSQRQEAILTWLQEKQTLTIDQLCRHFGVSNMTIHRDLDSLVQAGLVEKVHGGVMIAKPKPIAPTQCQMCGMTISTRTQFVIHTLEDETFQACCPHCGLMLMQGKAIKSALASDFIFCRMTNVLQATFVLESRIVLCCAPSVLCFASQEDAASFQVGFGGWLANYAETQAWLADQHHHHGGQMK